MSAEFFENELFKTRKKFNQTLGTMNLCNPRVRAHAIFAIIRMGLLKNKIIKDWEKEDISRFVITRNKLNQLFSKLIKETKKR